MLKNSLQHAFYAPTLRNYFEVLRIGASLWTGRREWYALNHSMGAVDPPQIEAYFGRAGHRDRYNERMARRAIASRATVIGSHAGYSDIFVPVISADRASGCVVAGPFAREPPEAGRIRKLYRQLSGRAPTQNDAVYDLFLRTALDTAVLEGEFLQQFIQDVELIAQMFSGVGDAASIFAGVRAAWRRTERTLFQHRMWRTASRFVDRLQNPVLWSSRSAGDLHVLGIKRRPTDVVVLVPARPPAAVDVTEWLLRARSFRFAIAGAARGWPNALCGLLGEDGVFLLLHNPVATSDARRRAAIGRAVGEARRVALRYGIELVAGVGARAARIDEIPERYAEALEAVGLAARMPDAIAVYDADRASRPKSLHHTARRLEAACKAADSAELTVVLEQGIRAVFARSAGSAESARAHFESLARELAGALERSALLEQRVLDAIVGRLERELAGYQQLHELAAAFERTARELVSAGVAPGRADRDARLDLARALIDADPTADLTLSRIARRVGCRRVIFLRSSRAVTAWVSRRIWWPPALPRLERYSNPPACPSNAWRLSPASAPTRTSHAYSGTLQGKLLRPIASAKQRELARGKAARKNSTDVAFVRPRKMPFVNTAICIRIFCNHPAAWSEYLARIESDLPGDALGIR